MGSAPKPVADPGEGQGHMPKTLNFPIPKSKMLSASGAKLPNQEARLVWVQNVSTLAYCDYKLEKTRHFCRFHWMFESSKAFSFRGASPPDPPTPVIGSRSTRSPCAPTKSTPWCAIVLDPSGTFVPQTPLALSFVESNKILKICPVKTRVLRLSVGKDFVILACVFLTQYQHVTDGQTNRQTTRSQLIQDSVQQPMLTLCKRLRLRY